MKPRRIAIVLLIGLAAIAVWWFMQSLPATTAKPAAAPSSKPSSSIAVAPLPSSQMPVVVTLAPASPAPLPDAPDADDPHAADLVALKTTIADQISLLEVNDLADYTRKYSRPINQNMAAQRHARMNDEIAQFYIARGEPVPPLPTQEEVEQKADQMLRDMPSTPAMNMISEGYQRELQTFQAIKNATPTFSKDGNGAVYLIDPAVSATLPGHPTNIHYHKENGQWYPGAAF